VQVGEISTILHDKLPRTLNYPVGASFLAESLAGCANLDHVAVYFLYDTAPQIGLYDPAKSPAERYTVMAVRRGLPVLRVPTLTGDLESHEDTASVLVFPVKARLRPRVYDSIREHALRPLQRWFAVTTDLAKQRALVLMYDEGTQRVTVKFAEDWTGEERDRRYF
jgi:hypothetical protein